MHFVLKKGEKLLYQQNYLHSEQFANSGVFCMVHRKKLRVKDTIGVLYSRNGIRLYSHLGYKFKGW